MALRALLAVGVKPDDGTEEIPSFIERLDADAPVRAVAARLARETWLAGHDKVSQTSTKAGASLYEMRSEGCDAQKNSA